MKTKWINFLIVLIISFSITGCGARLANQMIRITPNDKNTTPIQAAQCAAQQSGWSITFKDEQSLSATKTVGMDNVPLSLNIATQSKDSKASVTVNSPRGRGVAKHYQQEFLDAFSLCGASAAVNENESTAAKPEAPVNAPVAEMPKVSAEPEASDTPKATPLKRKKKSRKTH